MPQCAGANRGSAPGLDSVSIVWKAIVAAIELQLPWLFEELWKSLLGLVWGTGIAAGRVLAERRTVRIIFSDRGAAPTALPPSSCFSSSRFLRGRRRGGASSRSTGSTSALSSLS